MKPYLLIVDDFLTNFSGLREYADSADYQTKKGIDHHDYENMADVPADVAEEVLGRARAILGPVEMTFIALRLSRLGVSHPYNAHSDAFMGSNMTMVLYLNRWEHCQGGTSLLSHKETGETENYCANESAEWWPDRYSPDKWETVMHVPMKTNRAVFLPCAVLHQSEPSEGFGSNPEDGRCVLIAFFK